MIAKSTSEPLCCFQRGHSSLRCIGDASGKLGLRGFAEFRRTAAVLLAENKIDWRTIMSDNWVDSRRTGDNKKLSKPMRGNELIKKVAALGKERGIAVRVDKKRGKGSHQTLYFGERKTVIRNPKDELKTGTYHAMLKQLGISERDMK
jgi:mRNA interferase HicA